MLVVNENEYEYLGAQKKIDALCVLLCVIVGCGSIGGLRRRCCRVVASFCILVIPRTLGVYRANISRNIDFTPIRIRYNNKRQTLAHFPPTFDWKTRPLKKI